MLKIKANVVSVKSGEDDSLEIITKVVEESTGKEDLYYSTDYHTGKFTAEPKKGVFGYEVEEALKAQLDKNFDTLYDAFLDTEEGQAHQDKRKNSLDFVEDYSF
jgi:hypothetical protein